MTHTDGIVKNAWGKLTRIMWSRNPSGKAIVFIHGFPGDYSTWDGFPTMILQEPRLSGYDIFFLEYDWTERVRTTATTVKIFLNDIFVQPHRVFGSELRRIGRNSSQYDELMIVAHSSGAVVTRFALLDAQSEGFDWIYHTNLLLFAPAHFGADIIALGKIALGLFGQFTPMAADLLKTKFPALIDLEVSSDNTTLDILRDRTQDLIDSGEGQFTVAKEVVFGAADRIIVPGQFCSDLPFKTLPSVGYMEISNPTAVFPDPFNILMSHLL